MVDFIFKLILPIQTANSLIVHKKHRDYKVHPAITLELRYASATLKILPIQYYDYLCQNTIHTLYFCVFHGQTFHYCSFFKVRLMSLSISIVHISSTCYLIYYLQTWSTDDFLVVFFLPSTPSKSAFNSVL